MGQKQDESVRVERPTVKLKLAQEVPEIAYLMLVFVGSKHVRERRPEMRLAQLPKTPKAWAIVATCKK